MSTTTSPAAATNASASSIIATLNAGSGVNWSQLAADLSAVQFQAKTQRLTQQSELMETRISSASAIRGALSSLATAIGDGVRTGNLSTQPGVADAAVAQVSSPVGTSGKGSYSLEVQQIARAQTLASGVYGSGTDVVGAGTLTIRFGATTGTGFAADPAKATVDVQLAAGATLSDVAKAINAKGAGATAYVANTSEGAQLVLKGQEGEAAGFVVETTGAGLPDLAWDPMAGGDPARLKGAAQDALFRLDGLEMRSATNKTAQVAPGLQLTLTGTNAGAPTTITFASPVDNISSWMVDFVSSMNDIAGALGSAMAIGGELAADAGARTLRSQLARLPGETVMRNAAAGSPRTLGDLGVKLERDGTFTLDTARLSATLAADPAGVAAMFTTGLDGVYSTIDKLARNTSSTLVPGTLGYSIKKYQADTSDFGKQLTDIAERQEALRAQMVTRFSKVETNVNASRSTLSFLQQQIDAWNASRD
ncbi:flagellar hook protein [Croceibacterium mercuriale]|uniref:Flagellar hook-associated protein 2 n=1 Tax=Croceibacterium mercuriale TaxID=1572751 RepID=A0A0B2BXW5_9SPHN|nr:flagellar filament capping protein FliD [Croceibacterium mercuriale]KHL26264.1 flagellar hook protein [Croceibacterium mercuriale]